MNTIFENVGGVKETAYQFTVSSNVNEDRYQIPVVYFRYDISPITVKFKEGKEPFSHFLVQISAIIGGVFVVFNILSVFMARCMRTCAKKGMGKLF